MNDDHINRLAYDAPSPVVEPLLTGVANPYLQQLDGSHIYFTAPEGGYPGVLHRLPKAGGSLPEAIGPSSLNVRSVWDVSDSYAYITPYDSGPSGYFGVDVVARIAK